MFGIHQKVFGLALLIDYFCLSKFEFSVQRVIQSILHEALALRLLTLGIYPGKKIELIRQAPFRGACYVQVDDSVYVLRKEEWDAIVFQEINPKDGIS